MRFYSIVNGLYLSEIQKGIQTAHAVGEMSIECLNLNNDPLKARLNAQYVEWASKHKTIIVLDGTNCGRLKSVVDFMSVYAFTLEIPMTYFNEDENSLNGALTVVGFILSPRYYIMMKMLRERLRDVDYDVITHNVVTDPLKFGVSDTNSTARVIASRSRGTKVASLLDFILLTIEDMHVSPEEHSYLTSDINIYNHYTEKELTMCSYLNQFSLA